MTAILGLNFHHADSSAALVIDGELIAAVAEERLGRRLKHDPAFPREAIRKVLAMGGISAKDLSYVAVPRDTAANRVAKAQYVLTHPISSAGAVVEHARRKAQATSTLDQIAAACDSDVAQLNARIVPVEHHLAHISSAYYCSPFDGVTAGLSFDGSGDFASMMIARCEGTRIQILDRVHLPNSLGFFYTAACQFIGFDEFGEEYKVMGLAPYGENKYAEFMQDVVRLPEDGWFELKNGYFGMHRGGESGKLSPQHRIVMEPLFTDRWKEALGVPRARNTEVTQREKDIARSCQVRFEDAAMHCFNRLHKLVPTRQITYAGGCALNGVSNARLLRDTPFEQTYIQAAASDDGLSIGAAYWAWHNVAGGTRRFHMHHAYWGPEYDEPTMKRVAEGSGNMVRWVDFGQLPAVAAALIRAGLVLGWYQGRSEWGPRALGNRSILADPTQPHMKDLINAKIKRREMFRPFAPSIVRHAVPKFFEQDVFSPFMMHVVKIRPEWRDRLPAICHTDGTGRLQSIERSTNQLYFDLIEEFGKLSGIPILLNTSFNENEPVVDTPQQALSCFLRTGLDALCLGQHVVVKTEHEDTLRRVLREAGA